MTDLESILESKSIILPKAPTPVGAYQPTLKAGNYFYVSGQFPFQDGELIYKGKLGEDLNIEQGYAAAELCALNLFSQLIENMKSETIKQIVRVDGFIHCNDSFEEHAKVLDGATNLISDILGERAGHTRTVMGCNSLPYGAAVEIGTIVEFE